MKNPFAKFALILFVSTLFLSTSCKKDETTPSNELNATTILGDWEVTTAEGTEWAEATLGGTPEIITPRAADPETVGIILSFGTTTVTAKQGSTILGTLNYTLDVQAGTVLIGDNGNTGIGFYTITNFTGTSMKMDQRIPIDDDFSYNTDADNYLAFQKFWTLTKK